MSEKDMSERAVLDPLLDLDEVEALVKRKKSAIYAAVKTGQFPAPFRVGARRVAWKASEIQAHIDSLQRVSLGHGAH